MKVITGSYVGNGVVDREISIGSNGVTPILVILDGNYFMTSEHTSNTCSAFANNVSNQANIIKSLTANGFTVGTSAQSNANGTTYYYVAFLDTGAGDIKVGSYVGDGVNNRNITGIGFSPSVVAIKGNSGAYGWWKTTNMAGDSTLGFAGFNTQTGKILSVDADGFTLGTSTDVNGNGTTYYYFVFGTNAATIKVASYTGNNTDDRDITTVGFQPAMVWIKASNPIASVFRVDTNVGDSSKLFGGSYTTNLIQSILSNGFQIGNGAGVNELNTSNQYFAVSAGFTAVSKTVTAKATIANSTQRVDAKARIKKVVTQTSTARGRVFPRTAGALSTLPYRGIDVMKWTKDTTKNQPSDAIIENIVEFLQRNMNLTHVAVVLPLDPLTWYPSGYTPSPRTIIGTYQKWADEIHDRGLKVLHRTVSFGMEGQEGFTHRVGGNRYPQGSKQEIIPTTFSDNFNRSNIYTSITQSTSSFTDDFNRASLGSTDWNTIGNWSISGNELVCDNVANATSNIIYSKVNYTDFTFTAKVKKVSLSGFTGVAFRMTRNTNNGSRSFANFLSGYVLQLRDSGSLRVENIATSNLASVSKTWVSGSYYQVKVQCTGANIKAKVWLDGTSEPSTWDLDFNDTTYTTGGIGFCPENTGQRAVFDDAANVFNPTSNITSDWNTVGNWSIDTNTVKCTNAAAQYSNIMYSKTKYSNFTYQAKVKNPGTSVTALVFRLNTSGSFPGFSGYTVRIRNNSIFEIEDLSVSSLASTTKTFVADSWYQVKVSAVGSTIQAKVWLDGDSEPGTWDLSITNTKYTNGSVGFAPENISAAFFDDVTVTVATNYNTWLGIVYQFIVNNPTLFEHGDMWAPFPERTEGIFSDSSSFISYASPGVQANYATFFNDLKDVSDYAFAEIGKRVLTGHTANNFSEVRSGWLPQSIFDKAGIASFDYYQNYNQNLDFRAAQAKADIDAVYAARGQKLNWQEWGPVPDMITNISSTAGQAINGYGNIKSPNTGWEANREVFIRDFYTNTLAASLNEGKLEMFNYWGFWDTGSNDTGLAAITGSAATYDNIRFRREGWILAEYFSAGATPLRTVQARARISKPGSKTVTAKAKIVGTSAKTITAKAEIRNVRIDDFFEWNLGGKRPGGTSGWTVRRRSRRR
jgi:hypothetical protein